VSATPTPFHLAYVYVANAADNTISQIALNPNATPVLAPFAAPYVLPVNCAPAQIRLAPSASLAFVSCRQSSTIVTLQIGSDRALEPSPIPPIVLANVTYLLAPWTGAPSVLYAATQSGQISAFAYTPSAVRPLATYADAASPSAMTLYTNTRNVSSLYVASPSGINVWAQKANGGLRPRGTIATSSKPAVGIAAAWNSLYWSSRSTLGSYQLGKKRERAIPPPPYAQDAGGPATPDGLAQVIWTPPIVATPRGGNVSNGSDLSVATADLDFHVSVFRRDGHAVDRLALPAYGPIGPLYARSFSLSSSVNGHGYGSLYFVLDGNQLVLTGIPVSSSTSAGVLGTTPTGNQPSSLATEFIILGPAVK
jgi:hypothetical protein